VTNQQSQHHHHHRSNSTNRSSFSSESFNLPSSPTSSASFVFNKTCFSTKSTDFELMLNINKLNSLIHPLIQTPLSLNSQYLIEFNLVDNFLRLNRQLPDHFRYSSLYVNNLLAHFTDLPCSCGSFISFLNKYLMSGTASSSGLVQQNSSVYYSSTNSASSSYSNVTAGATSSQTLTTSNTLNNSTSQVWVIMFD
jgi:hypothetical protein